MMKSKLKDQLIVTFEKYDNDEEKSYLAKGFILTHGTKVVLTPEGNHIPVTVIWVCDLETGEINAYYPEDLVIGLNDNDLMDIL